MNKFRLMIMTAAMSLILSVSAFAAGGQISFSDPSATVGSEVNVTMKVKSDDATTLSKADITVAYDANLVEFESGTDSDGGAGTVRIHGATNGAGTTVLEYNLKFKTLAAGSAAVKIATQEVYDSSEQLVTIGHLGSSTITIAAEGQASNNAQLKELTVSPGVLTPAFSAGVTSYDVTVGTDVTTLAINALPEDSSAKVAISGNDNLNMGENNVTITVSAADGTTQAAYNLKVTKQEGGPSAGDTSSSETVNEGVKLSSKEKTITIMNPGSDVKIPEGFAESTIDIDGHQVKGWVWKADPNHEYCIVYGMNDAGELNFYRYDLNEKTLQRYFEDPVADQIKKDAGNYPVIVDKYDSLVNSYNRQFMISCILGVAVLALIIFVIVLLSHKNKDGKGGDFRKQNLDNRKAQKAASVKADEQEAEDLGATVNLSSLKRSTATETEKDDQELEITRIIKTADADAADIRDGYFTETAAAETKTDQEKQTETEKKADSRTETMRIPGVRESKKAAQKPAGKDLDIEEL